MRTIFKMYSQGQKYANTVENLGLNFRENPGLTTTKFRTLHNELLSLLFS